MTRTARLWLLASAAAPLLSPGLARADDAAPPAAADEASAGGIGEIVVTARRKEEDVQKVPVIVNTVSPEAFGKRGSTSIADLVQLVPGIFQNVNTDRSNIRFAIRGQQFTFATSFPAVVPYFAEVPLQRVSDGTFFDVDAVQVLKGPQGTLFGRVTDGGAILINPRKPTNEFGGYGELKVGNYDLREIQGALNVPIVDDKLAIRLAFDVNHRQGYTRNLFNGADLDNVSYQAVRLGIVFKPTENLENYTVINYNHANTNGSANIYVAFNPAAIATTRPQFTVPLQDALAQQQALGPRKTNQGTVGSIFKGDDGIFYNRKALWIVNKTTWTLGDNVALKNIFGYVWNKEPLGIDADGTTIRYNQTAGTFLPHWERFVEQFSNELQLQGSALDGKLDYTLGAYGDYQHSPGPVENFNYLYNSLVFSLTQYAKTRSRAVYGQIGYEILPGLKLNGGLRWTHDTVRSRNATYTSSSLDPNAIPHGQCLTSLAGYPLATLSLSCRSFSQSSKVLTYTAGIDYQATPDTFLYASLRRGYRPGGVNAIASLVTLPGYGPEYDLSAEVGVKADWSIGGVKVRTNLSAFRDKFKDIQRSVQFFPPVGPPATGLLNVAGANIKGFEFETTVIPTPGLVLNGSWAYLDAKYDDSIYRNFTPAQIEKACPSAPFTTAFDPTQICLRDPMPQTPKNSVRGAAHYTLPLDPSLGEISFGGDFYYVSDNYVTGAVISTGTIPAYTLYNLDATWKGVGGGPVDLTLFVNNVTNKTYEQSIVSNSMQVGGFGQKIVFYGPPRMYGLSLRYRFGRDQ